MRQLHFFVKTQYVIIASNNNKSIIKIKTLNTKCKSYVIFVYMIYDEFDLNDKCDMIQKNKM